MVVKERYLFKGSITVEAVFIIPMVIMTLFLLIYMSFYLHDKCLIQGTVNKVLHKASISVKHDSDIITGSMNYKRIGDRGIFYLIFGDSQEDRIKIENYLGQELPKGLFLSDIASINIKADKSSISIKVGVITKVKLPIFGYLFGKLSYREIMEKTIIHNPAETIRAAEVILDTGSSIKGVDRIKDKIDKFMDSLN